MPTPILATKLYIPPPRPKVVHRPRLLERLKGDMQRKLTLISAPAGFGKTTLVSAWIVDCGQPVAWLSLDKDDNDPARFLAYLSAAVQTLAPSVGDTALALLQSPQLPPAEVILTALLNDIATIPHDFILVLDDYHVIESQPVALAAAFLLEHLPPQMHLVIATREDPPLPLARLRARSQLIELRVADLRFTPAETASFLNQVMGLNVTDPDVAALEARTEGWIAGLQLAALSMQGSDDVGSFVKSFTGSHRFVLDYLVEEVLQKQPETVQTFLLRTSILNHMCGPLCEAVLLERAAPGQATLEYLERANLVLVPLDNERRWYRYHHLFAELLRQRLQQSLAAATGDPESAMHELHIRASQWYEDHGFDFEAFHHAAAGHDIERAERLIEGTGIPLHLRGAVVAILDWLESLPVEVLNARPSLWWRHASLMLIDGQTTGVEEKLDAAEAALQAVKLDARTRNLIGRIATARSVLALTRYQVDTMLAQSRRALEYLHPDNLATRGSATWIMGTAHLMRGDRGAARQALTEAIALSQTCGDTFTTILATISLSNIYESETQLNLAAEAYRKILQLVGSQPLSIIYEAHLGLARVLYQWNDLAGAEQHGQQSLHLARQYDRVIDRFIICEVFLARVKLAQGDVDSAAAMLAQASQSARQRSFVLRIPEVVDMQVLALLRQGDLVAAAQLAQTVELPVTSQARLHLAQGDPSAALTMLAAFHQQVEARNWQDERLKALVLQALAHHAHGDGRAALQLLGEALALAAPGGYIRLFIDEGPPMAQLLAEAAAHGILPEYVGNLLAAFETGQARPALLAQPLIDPLSDRELEVLQLIAQGLSNQEISERLFLALDTVKGHNRRIFDKLQVQRRTEAVARAREVGLL